MQILGILVFLLALIVAGEVIRSTLAANGEKIFAALAGDEYAPPIELAFDGLREPATAIAFTGAVRGRSVSRPVSPLPLAA